jgi:MFS family permease
MRMSEAMRRTGHAARATGGAVRSGGRRTGGLVHRVTGASGAGRTGLSTLIELTAAGGAGDAFVAVSLAGTIFFSTSVDQARGKVVLFLLVTMAPFAVLAPFIGPAMDRMQQGRRYLLAGTLLARGLLCWGMSAAINSPVTLLPAAFGILVLQKAYGVARASITPRLLPAEITLVTANARSQLITLTASLLGGGLAAGIEGSAGAAWVLRTGTLIYLAAMFLALRLPDEVDVPPVPKPAPAAEPEIAQVPAAFSPSTAPQQAATDSRTARRPVPPDQWAAPYPDDPDRRTAWQPAIPGSWPARQPDPDFYPNGGGRYGRPPDNGRGAYPSGPRDGNTVPYEPAALPPGADPGPNGDAAAPAEKATGRAGGKWWRPLSKVGPVVGEAMRGNAVLRAFSGYMVFFLAFLLRTGHFGVSHNFALGALVAAAAVGGLAAMAIGSLIKARAPVFILFTMLTLAPIVTAACAWFFSLEAAIAVAFTAALAAGLAKLSLDSTVQREIGEEIRSSAFAVSETLNQVSNVAGSVAGVLVSMLDNGQIGLAIPAAGLTAALVSLVARRRRGILAQRQDDHRRPVSRPPGPHGSPGPPGPRPSPGRTSSGRPSPARPRRPR